MLSVMIISYSYIVNAYDKIKIRRSTRVQITWVYAALEYRMDDNNEPKTIKINFQDGWFSRNVLQCI